MEWFLAALSGILAGLSYPVKIGNFELVDLGPLAFVAWVPLFWAMRSASPKKAFALGFWAGLFHYAISQYWLYTAVHGFGGLSLPTSLGVMLLLFAILSSYFGLIFYFSQRISRRLNFSNFWIRPLSWIMIEYCRSHFPAGGYSWSQMAYSQGGFLSFIQSADIWGVYGITFLIILCNEAIFALLQSFHTARYEKNNPVVLSSAQDLMKSWTVLHEQRSAKFLNWMNPALVFFLFISNWVYGYFQISHAPSPETISEISIGVVQGNISQDEKWDHGKSSEIMETYLAATQQLEAQGVELILWPEASWPRLIPFDVPELRSFKGRHADLLVGAVTYARSLQAKRIELRYNSAVLVNGQGEILDFYHKKHLVPFGEYIPFQNWLFFAKKLTEEVGDLRPGDEFRPIRWRDRQFGVLICYEDIFPDIAREMVQKGAVALISTTNDAWYGNSSAPLQHQSFSQFRSIETRRPILRAANTGISSSINTQGQILEQGPLFEAKNFIFNLALEKEPVTTLYVKFGDWLCYLAIFVVTLFSLVSLFLHRQPEAKA